MPKRKAAPSKISGLVDSDDDDLITGARDDAPAPAQDPDPSPRPTKRAKAQQTTAAGGTTATSAGAKRGPRKRRSAVVLAPKKRAAKDTGKTARKSNDTGADEEEEEAPASRRNPDEHDGVDRRAKRSQQGVSEDELGSPETADQSNKEAAGTGPGKHISTDGEFEYTAARPGRGRPPSRARGGGAGGRRIVKRQETTAQAQADEREALVPDNEKPAEDNDARPALNGYPSPAAPRSSPFKSHANGQSQRKHPTAQDQKRKSVRIDEPPETDAALRRKLGDVTKKYDSLETKYRNLREVAVVEANANAEKLRKQCEATTTASNELVASLKKELARQSGLAQRSHTLQKQLKERDAEVLRLQSELEELSTGLVSAQSETKTLQTKLAASRNAAVGSEGGGQGKGQGGSAKGANARNAAAGSAEIPSSAQLAQLKEDLYSDLTGLIVRDIKKQESQQLYDCIQTGLNGTLHFKLTVSDGSASYEEAEFHYTPFLDENRDAELMDILPEYLRVDIAFSRQNAAKFYSRIVDTLTKKRVER